MSGLAMMSAISRADRVNAPGGGAVEIVVTVCTQRRRLLGVFRIKSRNPHCGFRLNVPDRREREQPSPFSFRR